MQIKNMTESYDDGNIPEIDLPGNTRTAETIPDEVPRRDNSGSTAANRIPDEVPRRDGPGGDASGDIPLEVPQRGCPGSNPADGREAFL